MTANRDMQALDAALARFDNEPESYLVDLQMTLAELLLKHLRARRWSQRRLAQEAGMPESFVSRVLSGENVELRTIARMLCALRVRARITDFETHTLSSIGETDAIREASSWNPGESWRDWDCTSISAGGRAHRRDARTVHAGAVPEWRTSKVA